MGKNADAAFEISANGHLLTIEQGHTIPAAAPPGDGRWEACIQIAGHGEGQ